MSRYLAQGLRALHRQGLEEQAARAAVAPEVAMPPADRLLAMLDPKPTLLARVLLAMLGGAEWERSEGTPGHGFDLPRWLLTEADEAWRACWWDDGTSELRRLPDPFTDATAAWELETREFIGWRVNEYGKHRFGYLGPDGMVWVGAWPDRMYAAVRAALYKYADGPLAHLIRPTLERLEATC